MQPFSEHQHDGHPAMGCQCREEVRGGRHASKRLDVNREHEREAVARHECLEQTDVQTEATRVDRNANEPRLRKSSPDNDQSPLARCSNCDAQGRRTIGAYRERILDPVNLT